MTVWVDGSSRRTKKTWPDGGALPGLGSNTTNRRWLVFSNLDDLWPHFFFFFWTDCDGGAWSPNAEPLLGNLYPEGVIFLSLPQQLCWKPPPPTQPTCFSSSLFVSAVGKVSSMVAHDASSSDVLVGLLWGKSTAEHVKWKKGASSLCFFF